MNPLMHLQAYRKSHGVLQTFVVVSTSYRSHCKPFVLIVAYSKPIDCIRELDQVSVTSLLVLTK